MLLYAEYLRLIKEVNRLRNEIHLFDVEEISEAALDDLKHQVTEFETAYPDQIHPSSPNYVIAGGVSEKFEKFRHPYRMLSLNDVFDLEELQAWDERWQDYLNRLEGIKLETITGLDHSSSLVEPHSGSEITRQAPDSSSISSNSTQINFKYICEPKVDGLALSLHYDKGELVVAATRGDSWIGELVTDNIKQIRTIPKHINFKGKLEVRGEVFLTKRDFQELNAAITAGFKVGKMGMRGPEATFANSRNAASGTIRQLDSRIVRERNLSFIAYGARVE